MSKTFRSWDVDQSWLLPLSVHEFVPSGHLAHFVRDTVREALDLSAIFQAYPEERGQPPYHPGMLVALLLYGYSRGVYSSRQLARACEERMDFMAVTGLNRPDFRTVSDFRKRHLAALSALFVQVLRLCQRAGLVRLGHVAVDGTKLKANASRHKAMSYQRMLTEDPKLAAEVKAWLDAAEATDKAEDTQHGKRRRGDETPEWMANKRRRLERNAWPRRNWRPRQRAIRPSLMRMALAHRRACRSGAHASTAYPIGRRTRRSAISPMATAGSCPARVGSLQATTARSQWMTRTRSSPLTASAPTQPTSPHWCR
jgi:transposase